MYKEDLINVYKIVEFNKKELLKEIQNEIEKAQYRRDNNNSDEHEFIQGLCIAKDIIQKYKFKI